MNIQTKYEDVVAQLEAALDREAEVGRLYDSLVNRSNRERDASYKREDALRKELADWKARCSRRVDDIKLVVEARDALQQSLTVAEKRASVLESAAREMIRIAGIANQGSNAYNRAIINLNAALKPAEGEGS